MLTTGQAHDTSRIAEFGVNLYAGNGALDVGEEALLSLAELDATAGLVKDPIVVDGLSACPHLQRGVGETSLYPLLLLFVEVAEGIVVLVEKGAAVGDLTVLSSAPVWDVAKAVARTCGKFPLDPCFVEDPFNVDVVAGQVLSLFLWGEEGDEVALFGCDAQVT